MSDPPGNYKQWFLSNNQFSCYNVPEGNNTKSFSSDLSDNINPVRWITHPLHLESWRIHQIFSGFFFHQKQTLLLNHKLQLDHNKLLWVKMLPIVKVIYFFPILTLPGGKEMFIQNRWERNVRLY